jgi:Leucine-rich repeat (LRR) protein
LTKLTTLNLARNRLTELTVPAGLINVTMLDLGDNDLTSLNVPGGLTKPDHALSALDSRHGQKSRQGLVEWSRMWGVACCPVGTCLRKQMRESQYATHINHP